MKIEQLGFFSNTGMHSKMPILGVYYWYKDRLNGTPFNELHLPNQYLGTERIALDHDQRRSSLLPEDRFNHILLPLLFGKVTLVITDQDVTPRFLFMYSLQRPLSGLSEFPLVSGTAKYVPTNTPGIIQVMLGINEECMRGICRARLLPCYDLNLEDQGGSRYLL